MEVEMEELKPEVCQHGITYARSDLPPKWKTFVVVNFVHMSTASATNSIRAVLNVPVLPYAYE